MAAKDEIEFNNRYAELQKQIVIEITEEESIDYHALETKKNAPGFEGAFALDDYGSGYSNEKSLLDLAPKYIKEIFRLSVILIRIRINSRLWKILSHMHINVI